MSSTATNRIFGCWLSSFTAVVAFEKPRSRPKAKMSGVRSLACCKQPRYLEILVFIGLRSYIPMSKILISFCRAGACFDEVTGVDGFLPDGAKYLFRSLEWTIFISRRLDYRVTIN